MWGRLPAGHWRPSRPPHNPLQDLAKGLLFKRVLPSRNTVNSYTLNEQKTRIVHITEGFEFLGYKVKRGRRRLRLPAHKIRTGVQRYSHYVYPKQKAIDRFKDQIRKRTRRKAGIAVQQLIEDINPVIRGWGQYYCKAHVRGLFNRLSRWIVQRIWSYRFKRW